MKRAILFLLVVSVGLPSPSFSVPPQSASVFIEELRNDPSDKTALEGLTKMGREAAEAYAPLRELYLAQKGLEEADELLPDAKRLELKELTGKNSFNLLFTLFIIDPSRTVDKLITPEFSRDNLEAQLRMTVFVWFSIEMLPWFYMGDTGTIRKSEEKKLIQYLNELRKTSPSLKRSLASKDPTLRAISALVLDQLSPTPEDRQALLPVLKEASQHPDLDIRNEAQQALGALEKKAAPKP